MLRTVAASMDPQQTIQRLTEAKKFARPIVTQVVPAVEFWKAEEYHQKYFDKNGGESCHVAPDGELD